MNLNNTKLDLSEYSEEERNKILWAYSYACGKSLVEYPSDCRFYFCNPTASHITFERKSVLYFKNHGFTEVKPVKRESWESIKSIDELKVGDTVSFERYDFEDTVVYVGNDLAVVKSSDNQGEYVIASNLSNFRKKTPRKKTTTYSFEPVIDDSFAIECYQAFTTKRDEHIGEGPFHFEDLSDDEQQGWRAVAALKQSKDSE